jgi:hypothetical protein
MSVCTPAAITQLRNPHCFFEARHRHSQQSYAATPLQRISPDPPPPTLCPCRKDAIYEYERRRSRKPRRRQRLLDVLIGQRAFGIADCGSRVQALGGCGSPGGRGLEAVGSRCGIVTGVLWGRNCNLDRVAVVWERWKDVQEEQVGGWRLKWTVGIAAWDRRSLKLK